MYDVMSIRNDFPMLKNHPDMIFFDSGATSLKPQCVIDAVTRFYTEDTANIHRGDYDISFKVSKEYDETREVLRKFLNARKAEEIVFTNGATSSLNTVAYGYGLKYLKEGDVILTSYAEHASSILPWYTVKEKTACDIIFTPLTDDGHFDLDAYKECLNKHNVKLVALPMVSNVLGYKYPVKEITRLAHEKGAVVSIDGAQGVPHCLTDVQDLDCDFLSFSSHKMLGPGGVGVLYGKEELLTQINTLTMGGGANARFDKDFNVILKNAPIRFEAGTPSIEGVLGLKAAVEYLMNIGMKNVEAHDKEMAEYLSSELAKLDNVVIYNPETECSIVSFNVKGVFAQDSGTYLNKNNICVRTGNHCAKLLHNVIDEDQTIRASLYIYNTKEEIDRFVKVVSEITLEKCIGAII
ncbi:MAG: aminotransferase class V-fold PLP-dependent enzyme [Erysipelotrichaceae bacterium]|nr:aminotransferase class V-fold PLP-dependent enzyme [Erysipelotrichaceae bacterium]